jgi:hypothetical protein
MDWSVHTARWVLSRLPGEALPDIAVQALLQGEDSPSLRLLAGESPRAPVADLWLLFEAALSELGVKAPTQEIAVMGLAKAVAEQLLHGTIGTRQAAEQLVGLARELPKPPECMFVFLGLESELSDFSDRMRLDYYGEERCREIRTKCEDEILEACRVLLGIAVQQAVAADDPAAGKSE